MQDDKYKFCKKCGAPLTAEEMRCAHCGEAIEPDAAFCPFCGTAVNAASQTRESREVQPQKSQRAVGEESASGNSFYDGGAAAVDISARKPLVIGQKGQYIGAMVKAWVMAVLFLLMFGLSFLSFMKIDISNYVDVEEPVKVSAVDVLEVAFSKKQSEQEVKRQFRKLLNGKSDDAAVSYALKRFNALKFIYNKDNIDAMPFSANVTIVLQTTLVLALMLGSLAFAVLFFIEALMLTTKGKSAFRKDIAGLGLGIMTAIALFALSMTINMMGNGIGGGPLSAMIIGLSALALNTVYNAVIARKRPVSVKGLVSRCVSLALGITLLFTLTCNAYAVKTDVERESLLGKTYTETVTEGLSIDNLAAGIDIFSSEKGDALYFGDTALSDLIEISDPNGEVHVVNKEDILIAVLPPMLYYYAEMNSGYNAAGLVLGILSFILYFMTGISLAVLLAFLMVSLTDFKKRSSFTTHLLSLIGFAGILVVSIICPATASGILNQLGYDEFFKCVICAAPIVNIVLATGMFVQHCTLRDRKKKE